MLTRKHYDAVNKKIGQRFPHYPWVGVGTKGSAWWQIRCENDGEEVVISLIGNERFRELQTWQEKARTSVLINK